MATTSAIKLELW